MGSKSYKTWLLTDLAVSVASGIEWLGRSATEGRGLYVNLQIQRAFYRKRVKAIAEAKGLPINEATFAWTSKTSFVTTRSKNSWYPGSVETWRLKSLLTVRKFNQKGYRSIVYLRLNRASVNRSASLSAMTISASAVNTGST